MADEQLNELLRFRPWPPGDPWVLVEAVLREVDPVQKKQVMGAALESVSATLQANLKLVDGLRQIVGKTTGH
jgi:hypothetical protein